MDYECEVRFQCPHCGRDVVATIELVETPLPSERDGIGIEHTSVECPECKEEHLVQTYFDRNMVSVAFTEYPEARIEAGSPQLRDVWEDYDIPDDPYSILNSSLTDASVLLDEIPGSRNLLNRLVFANFITAFEVFLSDTLINRVLSNEKALNRLIEKDKVLRGMRFSLSDIAAAPNLIKDSVRTRLRSVMWHNIKNASALYNYAFGIDILEIFGDDTPRMLQAIEYRHDCVHRNGRDKDDNEINVFTKEYVNQVGLLLARVGEEINRRLRELDAQDFFGPPSPEIL